MSVTGTVQQHDLLRVKDRYALKKIFQPFIFLLRSFRDCKKSRYNDHKVYCKVSNNHNKDTKLGYSFLDYTNPLHLEF